MLTTLCDQDIRGLLTFGEVREELMKAFSSLATGGADILHRRRVETNGVKFSTMGALWVQAGLAGERSYATLHGRFSFVTTLWDLSTNRALVAIEGDELTRLRTPAMAAMVVGAAAARTGTLALFGAGHQGRAHLDALLSLVPFREVRLFDPQADLKALCQWLDSNHGVRAHACSGDEAVSGADVVVTTTRSKDPVFDGARLTPGATVIAMGSSIPTARELDDETLRRAARVGVEFRPQSLVEAGELVLGLESGALNPAKIHDLSDFFSGKAIWRRHGEEIVVFKSVGVGLADVATAAAVWRRWLERSAGASHQVPSGAQATGS